MRKTIHPKVLGLRFEKEIRSPHDCRRTYATLEYLNGTNKEYIQGQLGHASLAQTDEYIKPIIEAYERRDKIKGLGFF